MASSKMLAALRWVQHAASKRTNITWHEDEAELPRFFA